MRTLLTLLVVTAIFCSTGTYAKDNGQLNKTGGLVQKAATVQKKHQPSMNNDDLYFIENKGQITDQKQQSRKDVQFSLAANGVNVFIGNGQLHYQFGKATNESASMYRMDVALVNANKHAQVITEDKQAYFEKYYTPGFGKEGAIVHAYRKITYKEVYPNIDWVLYIKDNQLEYDFVVRPGANVADIQISHGGATTLGLDKESSLIVTTPMGSVSEKTPYSYQAADGNKVTSSFVLNDNILSFRVAPYQGTLVIDPTLNWGTYYGGTQEDEGTGVSCDAFGHVYMSGYTSSLTNIATTGSYQDTLFSPANPNTAPQTGFLVKFDSSGNRIWATYYGYQVGSTPVINVDPLGNIYTTGYTASQLNIATTGSHQDTSGGSYDAFLEKFDSAGNLKWGTYYGGLGADYAFGVCTDRWGHVFIGGATTGVFNDTGYAVSSNGIATSGAYQDTFDALTTYSAAFLAKFDSTGQLIWGTYFGSSNEQFNAISCDTAGNVYATGFAQSPTGIATPNSFQDTIGVGGQSSMLEKFDSSGQLLWGTYYGNEGYDYGAGVACDNAGHVYMCTSTTGSTAMATTGSFDTIPSYMILAAFNSAGQRQWSTYYGNTDHFTNYASALSCDNAGDLYMVGIASSDTYVVTPDGYLTTYSSNGSAAFLSIFDSAGSLHWGTYCGGGSALAVSNDGGGNVYITGSSSSNAPLGIITTGSYQNTISGGADAFLAKFNNCIALAKPSNINGLADTIQYTFCSADSVHTFYIPPVLGAGSYQWTLPAGWSGASTTDTIVVTSHGTGTGVLYVSGVNSCGNGPQQQLTVAAQPLPILAIASLGNTTFCEGDSATILVNASGYYPSLLHWAKNGTDFLDSVLSYTVYSSGVYSVTAGSLIGSNTCVVTDSITITVHPLPDPVIGQNASTLSTGSYATYQWYMNGTPVANATNQTYSITADGTYSVMVTDSNGCSKQSQADTISNLGVSIMNANDNIHIYPNPVQSMVYIDASVPVNAYLYGIDGKALLQQVDAKPIDMSNLPNGMYLIRVTSKEGILLGTQKLVKSDNK